MAVKVPNSHLPLLLDSTSNQLIPLINSVHEEIKEYRTHDQSAMFGWQEFVLLTADNFIPSTQRLALIQNCANRHGVLFSQLDAHRRHASVACCSLFLAGATLFHITAGPVVTQCHRPLKTAQACARAQTCGLSRLLRTKILYNRRGRC